MSHDSGPRPGDHATIVSSHRVPVKPPTTYAVLPIVAAA